VRLGHAFPKPFKIFRLAAPPWHATTRAFSVYHVQGALVEDLGKSSAMQLQLISVTSRKNDAPEDPCKVRTAPSHSARR